MGWTTTAMLDRYPSWMEQESEEALEAFRGLGLVELAPAGTPRDLPVAGAGSLRLWQVGFDEVDVLMQSSLLQFFEEDLPRWDITHIRVWTSRHSTTRPSGKTTTGPCRKTATRPCGKTATRSSR